MAPRDPISPPRVGKLEPGQISENPLAIDEQPSPSPEEAQKYGLEADQGVRERLASSPAVYPSLRQQTQSEILNIALLLGQLGNPFSTRRLPYSVMRDMITDPMIWFGYYYTIAPIIRAPWLIESSDAQLAAAVDAILRPHMSTILTQISNCLLFGNQPMVKRFELGNLSAKYRDPNSDNPDEDLDAWPTGNVKALLLKEFVTLAPENCLPRWDNSGEFAGFIYSPFPIPNPEVVGVAATYGENILSGWPIPKEYALWSVNERQSNFGSIYGSPLTKRVYRFWWSFWFRWALADRSFENKADPAKLVYFPTDIDEAVDTGDPGLATGNPRVQAMRTAALNLGQGIRSGATVAIPGDFMRGEDGKSTTTRRWEVSYLSGGENFDLLDKTFSALDVMKLQGMLVPPQAYIEGHGGSSSRNVASTLGNAYQEATLIRNNEWDEIINTEIIPQIIAANFPEKIGVPCRKATKSLIMNVDLVQQLVTLIGQTKGQPLPVDVRKLLEQYSVPLLSDKQYEALQQRAAMEAGIASGRQTPISEEKDIPRPGSSGSGGQMQPPETPPTPRGTQGQNAMVTRTNTGETRYVQMPQKILLDDAANFLASLPELPPYQDGSIRALAKRLHKTYKDRYRRQIKSFADSIRNRKSLNLAATQAQTNGGAKKDEGRLLAEALVAGWVASQTKDVPDTVPGVADTLGRIASRSAAVEIKNARLDSSVFNAERAQDWANKISVSNLDEMDETVRDELTVFLTDELAKTTDPEQVAAALEEHFSDLPETHASRAARSQTRDGWIHGSLQAASDAGVSQIMFHDASDGTDTTTDRECQLRNGKIMTPSEAMGEATKLHPRCTGYVTWLSTENLSVQFVDEMPETLDEWSKLNEAAYDSGREILYIHIDADEERRLSYVLEVGEALRIK